MCNFSDQSMESNKTPGGCDGDSQTTMAAVVQISGWMLQRWKTESGRLPLQWTIIKINLESLISLISLISSSNCSNQYGWCAWTFWVVVFFVRFASRKKEKNETLSSFLVFWLWLTTMWRGSSLPGHLVRHPSVPLERSFWKLSEMCTNKIFTNSVSKGDIYFVHEQHTTIEQ